ncbi:MAG: hypothetical protein AB7F96_16415 [Beijerinckiaceae bacterium]
MTTPVILSYPGLLQSITGNICPVPTSCCYDAMIVVKPGEKVPRFIDVSSWIAKNYGPVNDFKVADTLVDWQFKELVGDGAAWPADAAAPVLPHTVGTYFTVSAVEAFNGDDKHKGRGYVLTIDVQKTAGEGNVLRLDLSFNVTNNCGMTGRGTFRIAIRIDKCS